MEAQFLSEDKPEWRTLIDMRHVTTDFTNVDASGNAAAHVDYLDLAGSLNFVQDYKQRTFDLLRLRRGDRVLDLGCGTGDDVRAIAHRIAPGGLVVGLDSSAQMISEARARGDVQDVGIHFEVGDACHLQLDDAIFDACRADRVLQHVADPELALAEMVRVARRGARITVSEPDWDTLVIDAEDRDLTRRILNAKSDEIRNGWIGRQLARLLGQSGLNAVEIFPVTFVTRDLEMAERLYGLRAAADGVVDTGVLSRLEADAWLAQLRASAEAGRFFCSICLFTAVGEKP